ncbi:MAG: 6-phosphogluconolactonase [candidate division Zixibacteria bacterium]|nr:6-phosphogluconolactonase [candidate division Zixibacteria bacterium]
MPTREIVVCQDRETLARAAAQFVLGEVERKESGRFLLALSGGTTPARLYDILAETPSAGELLSSLCELFFSDERPVGPDHFDSNYRTAQSHLFEPLRIDERIIHRMRGESKDLYAEAGRYASLIREKAGVAADAIPRLDLTILGMGPDGHTSSLFPGYDFESENDLVVAPFVPALKTHRLSFGLRLINASRAVLVLVSGEEKAAMVKKVLDKSIVERELPASRVAAERTVWMLDTAAAGKLDWTGPVLGL